MPSVITRPSKFARPSMDLNLPTVDENKDVLVQSSTDVGTTYVVNLHTMTCSCPDFVKTKTDKRIGSVDRLCKHLRKSLLDSQFIKGTVYEPILAEKFWSKSFLRLKDVDITIGFTEGKEWINVYALGQPTTGGETRYERHGFSLVEQRWAYDKAPLESQQIESAIRANFPTGSDAINKTSDAKDSVVIELKIDPDTIVKALSSNTPAPRTSALPGTYDKSYFNNPETGRFQFPKYKHDKRFKVRITDTTNYRDMCQWDLLDSEERQNFSMSDFEHYFNCPDIEVDDFNEFLNQMGTQGFEQYKFLKGRGAEIEEIAYEVQQTGYAKSSDPFRQELLARGYVNVFDFRTVDEKDDFIRQILDEMKVGELRAACIKEGIDTKSEGKELKKDELLTLILQSGKGSRMVDPRIQPIVPNETFHQMLDSTYDAYIADIKENLKRFHPLYCPTVWDEVSLSVDKSTHPALSEKVKDVIDSKYWEANLI